MKSKATLRNRMQAAGYPYVRHLLKQFDKHPIQCPSMQWAFLAGEEKVRSIIHSDGEVSFETGIVRQRGLSTMLDKCLSRFEAALEPSDSDGPVSHIDIGER